MVDVDCLRKHCMHRSADPGCAAAAAEAERTIFFCSFMDGDCGPAAALARLLGVARFHLYVVQQPWHHEAASANSIMLQALKVSCRRATGCQQRLRPLQAAVTVRATQPQSGSRAQQARLACSVQALIDLLWRALSACQRQASCQLSRLLADRRCPGWAIYL
jgi:hypothetical protein